MGRRLARRPLLGLVQQAAQWRFPAGVEAAFAVDPYTGRADGVFSFRIWWRGGAALDCFVCLRDLPIVVVDARFTNMMAQVLRLRHGRRGPYVRACRDDDLRQRLLLACQRGCAAAC